MSAGVGGQGNIKKPLAAADTVAAPHRPSQPYARSGLLSDMGEQQLQQLLLDEWMLHRRVNAVAAATTASFFKWNHSTVA